MSLLDLVWAYFAAAGVMAHIAVVLVSVKLYGMWSRIYRSLDDDSTPTGT